MFIEKDKKSNRIETLIGDKCSITGSIKGCGLLKIDGYIEGDINWQDDIIIDNTSLCKSNIYCKSAIIGGKVTGNIICEDTLVINNTGNVTGDLTAKSLIIREGGFLDGKCSMIVSGKAEDLIE